MAKIVVGLWSRKVQSKYNSLASTLFNMGKAVKITKEFVTTRGLAPVQGEVKSIFLAPEFLFTNTEDHKASSTAMGRKHRDWVLGKLVQMSQDSPSMLLVPGTIVFKESTSAMHKSYWTQAQSGQTYGAKAIENLKNAATPRAHNTLAPRVYTGSSKFQPHPTQESASHQPEDLKAFYNSQAEKLNQQEANQAIRQNRVDTFVVKNRTYVFLDGAKKFTYGKKCSCNDFATDAQQGIYVPGRKEGVTRIGDLNIGIEICYDHDRGTLQKHLSGKALDLHLILSAEVPGSDSFFMVKQGGYVLHASSSALFTGVAQKKAAKDVGNPFINLRDKNPDTDQWKTTPSREFEGIPPLKEEIIDDGPLRLYEIEVTPGALPTAPTNAIPTAQGAPTGGGLRGVVRGGGS